MGDVLDLAANINVINKSGAWYAYEGNKIGQGRENAKQYLKDNPEVCAEVALKVREHFGLGGAEKNEKEAEKKVTPKPEADKKETSKAETDKPKASKVKE